MIDLLSDVLQLLPQIAARLHQNFLLIITAYFWSVQHENGSGYKQQMQQMRAGCIAWLSSWAVPAQKPR